MFPHGQSRWKTRGRSAQPYLHDLHHAHPEAEHRLARAAGGKVMPPWTRSWGMQKTPISLWFMDDIYIYIYILVSNFEPHIDKDTYVYMLFLLFIISSGK